MYLTGFLKPEAAVLADGTKLGVWQYERATAYAADDGTELLKVEEPVGPDYNSSSSLSLNDLDEDVLPLLQPWAVPDTKNTP